jgi:hypothetical protein
MLTLSDKEKLAKKAESIIPILNGLYFYEVQIVLKSINDLLERYNYKVSDPPKSIIS